MRKKQFIIIILALMFTLPLTGTRAMHASPKGVVTVTGYWRFLDRDSNLRNLKYARVEVWDYNETSPDIKLGEAYTNSSGYYSINVNSDEPGGPDIYDKVFSRDDHSVWVGSSISDINSTFVYSTTNNIHWNIGGGTLNLGVRSVPDDDNKWAFYIYDLIADDAWDYLHSTVGWNNDYNLAVEWYHNSPQPTGYQLGVGIYISGWDQVYPDVILHEYSHFVMYKIYNSYPPTPNCGQGHHWGGHTSQGCAWSEGWAHFLQAAIQNDKVYTIGEGTPYDLEIPYPSATHASDEGAVAAALWDVFDDEVESWDLLFSGLGVTWDIVDNQNPNTAIEFKSDWLARSDVSPCGLISIFEHHLITTSVCTYAHLPYLKR